MIKFVATVNDEVGTRFKELCAQRGQSPYDFLVSIIYKAVQMERRLVPMQRETPFAQRPSRVAAVEAAAHASRDTCQRCGRPAGDCGHTSGD